MRGRLSIFNFESKSRKGLWAPILIISFLSYMTSLMGWEFYLNEHESMLSVRDDYSRWARVRSGVEANNPCALVIVGASRSQMAIDLDEMERFAPSRPSQLSIIDGESITILESIANDTTFVGTVLFSFAPNNMKNRGDFTDAQVWVDRYEKERLSGHAPPYYFRVESKISDFVGSRLSLTKFSGNPMGEFIRAGLDRYTFMDNDRRIYADFSRVDTDSLKQGRLRDYIGIPPAHRKP